MKQFSSLWASLLALVLALCLGLTGCSITFQGEDTGASQTASSGGDQITLDNLPEYEDSPYVELYDNEPDFSEDDLTTEPFEDYSELDDLGRCGTAYANVCLETMPTEERGSISQVKPTGWQSVTYDHVDGKHLYNRCHLIGFQLTAENANRENLITGTRYLNVEGMLPFENMVADYVHETEHHVLYRVTPVFEGQELVARGVQMEALSVEDEGEGICFNVYCYNVQPGVTIDYATGQSELAEVTGDGAQETYILNTKGRKFHLPDCSSVNNIHAENREEYTGSREALIAQGYSPCGSCKP